MPKQNTDKELYRESEGDYYSPSLHVTKDGLIGINVGGSVHVMRLRDWHERAQAFIIKIETTHNSGYMVRKAKALLSQIAKATSYIRKRCTQYFFKEIKDGNNKRTM